MTPHRSPLLTTPQEGSIFNVRCCLHNEKDNTMKTSWLQFIKYTLYKGYLRLIHEQLLVRHRYTQGLENLPAYGERFLIVANHQNTANDPLNITFALPLNYHISALARANVFSLHPLLTRYFYWIGLLPAYRFGWEGGEGIEHNFESFDLVASRINNGQPVIVFPEAGHTQGHYIGRFTTGTVRMAFHAAKNNGFREDVKIVPTAHHYSDYFDIQTDFLWRIGEPISLKPYYDAFQEHPNSVMRNITRELHSRIHAMMLDEGVEDYEAKDFLRNSSLNTLRTPDTPLPDRLAADQHFARHLNEHPRYNEIINLATELQGLEEILGIDEATLQKAPSRWDAAVNSVLLLLLLPLWLISLWPHGICYRMPTLLLKTDKMFTNSYRYILSAVILYPLFALLTFLIMGLVWGWWWQSLLWILLWIPTGRFAWWYYSLLRRTRHTMCYLRASHDDLEAIKDLQSRIKVLLNTVPYES